MISSNKLITIKAGSQHKAMAIFCLHLGHVKQKIGLSTICLL